jgi:hypothetical protein
MSFRDRLSEDSINTFLNTGEFAESITYTPSVGSPKVIKAIIVREGLEPSSENSSRSLRKQAEVYIANDETNGVVSIDKKDDRITFDDVEGEPKEARINEILGKDDGMWHLLVGW